MIRYIAAFFLRLVTSLAILLIVTALNSQVAGLSVAAAAG